MARTILALAAIAVTSAFASAGPAPAKARMTAAPLLRREADPQGQVPAIIPTASGQIGINPVSSELGDPNAYELTDLGPENQVVTYQGNTYHYIQGHTDYLTIETVTNTVNNKPTSTTSEVKVAVSTAKSDGADQKAGDVALVFAPVIAAALRKTADDAIQACGLAPGKKRRLPVKRLDTVSCMIDKAVKASGENGPLEAAGTDEFWAQLGIDIAANAPEYLANALAVIASQAQKKKTLIILGSIIVGVKVSGEIAAVNIPDGKVGAPSPNDNANKKCDPSKPVGEGSPLCSDKDCEGKDKKCTAGDDKGCACLIEGEGPIKQVAGLDLIAWWEEQQKILGEVIANPNLLGGSATPACSINSDGNDFNGKPAADPSAWCVCDMDGKNLIYPTLTQKDSPCAFTKTPTATISPKVIQTHGGSVTSCRVSVLPTSGATTGGIPYCTCNDNNMHPLSTWTDGGKVTTGCGATHTPSAGSGSGATGGAAPSPTCNIYRKLGIKKDSLISTGKKFCADQKGKNLRTIPSNPYSGAQTEYFEDGASGDGQIYMFAYLDKGCDKSINIDENDCNAAVQAIFNRCDTDSDTRMGGAASINCQWYNMTAVDKCMGSSDSFSKPGSCSVGNLPGGYGSWPLGSTPDPGYDPNSDACKKCSSNLGNSDCKADDGKCLMNQCSKDDQCKTCKIDCSQYGIPS